MPGELHSQNEQSTARKSAQVSQQEVRLVSEQGVVPAIRSETDVFLNCRFLAALKTASSTSELGMKV